MGQSLFKQCSEYRFHGRSQTDKEVFFAAFHAILLNTPHSLKWIQQYHIWTHRCTCLREIQIRKILDILSFGTSRKRWYSNWQFVFFRRFPFRNLLACSDISCYQLSWHLEHNEKKIGVCLDGQIYLLRLVDCRVMI